VKRRWAALIGLVSVLGGLSAGPIAADADPIGGTADVAAARGVEPPVAAAGPLGIPAAVSVALVEAGTGQVLAAQDATTRRPIASAIKLLTALVVVDALPAGTVLTVGEEVRGVEGASYGLRPGEARSVDELLAGLLLRSGNDVAVALAVAVAGSEEAFVGLMAERLMALGVEARPASASGLDEGDALSALELAAVARASLAEPRIRDIVGRSTLTLPGGAELENRNAFLTDDATATGLKTGFTNAAGFTLAASSARDGRTLIAIVLGARDDAERRDVARRLMEHGFTGTRPMRAAATLGLRTAAGAVALRADLGTLTVSVSSEVRYGWPRTLRPTDTSPRIALLVDGEAVGTVVAERLDARDGIPVAGLGRALADGVYAALRPSAIALAVGPDRSGPEGLR